MADLDASTDGTYETSRFWLLMDRIRVLDDQARAELSRRDLDAHRGDSAGTSHASAAAYSALAAADRGTSTEMAAVAEAQDLIQGGEDLALAVLASDLISAEDYHLLTGWAGALVPRK
jgi:hypothetical protein